MSWTYISNALLSIVDSPELIEDLFFVSNAALHIWAAFVPEANDSFPHFYRKADQLGVAAQ